MPAFILTKGQKNEQKPILDTDIDLPDVNYQHNITGN